MNPPLPRELAPLLVNKVPLRLTHAEAHLIRTALLMSKSMVEAGKMLGVSRHAIKRRCVKHGIDRFFYLSKSLEDYRAKEEEI